MVYNNASGSSSGSGVGAVVDESSGEDELSDEVQYLSPEEYITVICLLIFGNRENEYAQESERTPEERRAEAQASGASGEERRIEVRVRKFEK